MTQTLVGPFRQVLTMRHLPLKGPIDNHLLEIIREGAILIEGDQIVDVAMFEELKTRPKIQIHHVTEDRVALPGLIDCHTHICYAGNRYADFEDRNSGLSYLEIAQKGGGIHSTVEKTRAADEISLLRGMTNRMDILRARGVTTVEIKSGYGLNLETELKMLRAIKRAHELHSLNVVPTCLAAHLVPKEFDSEESYFNFILTDLIPIIIQEKLSSRFDIFIEDGAFTPKVSRPFLKEIKNLGFDIVIHGDQFHTGGSQLAIDVGALSVDHLEISNEKEISALAQSNVIAVGLPGASIGLGSNFVPARRLLDEGCSLAIASDWNPGSAPQGNLVAQASILATYEKLSAAEVLSGITFRAAKALKIENRGKLESGFMADIVTFPCKDFREILYHQGELTPSSVWINGAL